MISAAKSLVNCWSGGLQQEHAHPTTGRTRRSWLAGTNSHQPWRSLGIISGVPSGRSSSAGRSPSATRFQYQSAEEIVDSHLRHVSFFQAKRFCISQTIISGVLVCWLKVRHRLRCRLQCLSCPETADLQTLLLSLTP